MKDRIDLEGFIECLNDKCSESIYWDELIVSVFGNLKHWAKECKILSKKSKNKIIKSYEEFVSASKKIIESVKRVEDVELVVNFCDLYNQKNSLIYDSYLLYANDQIKRDLKDTKYRYRVPEGLNELKDMPKKKEELEQDLISLIISKKKMNIVFESFNNYRPLIKSLVDNKDDVINIIDVLPEEINNDNLFLMLNCIKQFIKNDAVIDNNSQAFKRLVGALNVSNNPLVQWLAYIDYKTLKKGIEGLYSKNADDEEITDLMEMIHEIDSNNSRLDDIKELSEKIETCIEKRENDFAMSTILLAGDIGDEEKKELLNIFFNNGYDYGLNEMNVIFSNHFSTNEREKQINSLVERLTRFATDTLINMIVAGEHLFEKIGPSYSELRGDYTFLVASQIKAVDRYIKETIIRRLQGDSIRIIPNSNPEEEIIDGSPLDSLDERSQLKKATIGNLNVFMSKRLAEDAGNVSKLFNDTFTQNKSKSVFFYAGGVPTFFSEKFCTEIRNSKFHSYNIESVRQAIETRNSIAFWLACLLIELK